MQSLTYLLSWSLSSRYTECFLLFTVTTHWEHGYGLARQYCINQLWRQLGCLSRKSVSSGSGQPDHFSYSALPQWSKMSCTRSHLSVSVLLNAPKNPDWWSVVLESRSDWQCFLGWALFCLESCQEGEFIVLLALEYCCYSQWRLYIII